MLSWLVECGSQLRCVNEWDGWTAPMQVSRVKKKLKVNAPTTRLWLAAIGQGSSSRHAVVIDMEPIR
jgi:hypothetical protein